MDPSRQVMLLEQKLDRHEQKLDDHIAEFDRHRAEEESRWEHLIELSERNAETSANNTAAVQALASSTHDMVEAWNATNGAVKVGAAIGRFLKWASGFAVVAVAFQWFIEHFGK